MKYVWSFLKQVATHTHTHTHSHTHTHTHTHRGCRESTLSCTSLNPFPLPGSLHSHEMVQVNRFRNST